VCEIDARLDVIRFEDEVKDREYIALPCVMGDSALGIFNNTVDAACVALTERYLNLKVDGVLTAPIQAEEGVFNTPAMVAMKNFIVRGCKRKAHVYSRREVVEMYTGPKRKLYEDAMLSLEHTPLEKKDAWLKTFIKFEKTDLSKAPRVINPRTTRYTLELARYLKKLEKPVYHRINKFCNSVTNCTIVKGLNVVDSATVLREKWDRFVSPCFVGGDITKLDMHIGVDALEHEHSIYNKIFSSRRLNRLLKWQLLNKGKAYFGDGSVAFKMRGTRCSGDINTSLGNVIVVCSVIIPYLQSLLIDFELIDNGDDFGVFFESEHLQLVVQGLPEWFKRHGFVLTMEAPVFVFEQVEFCQTKPVFDGEVWRMCRLPQTVFRKDTICTIPIQNSKIWRKWLGAVGDCGLSLTKGLPVLGAFYRAFKRSGVVADDSIKRLVFRNTSMMSSIHNLHITSTGISEDARVSFYNAFGIVPDMQRCLEEQFDNLSIDSDFTDLLGTIRENNLVHPSIRL